MAKKKSKFDTPIGKIDIRGTSYNIFLYPYSLYKNRHHDSEAHMTQNPPQMHFCDKYMEYGTVSHELFHCYVKSCFYDFVVNSNAEDLEEIACEIFANFGEEIIEKAKKITELLKNENQLRKGSKNESK